MFLAFTFFFKIQDGREDNQAIRLRALSHPSLSSGLVENAL